MSKHRNPVSKRSSPARFTSVALLMIFIIYSLFTQFSLPELVVCLGDNGHIAIESPKTELHCALTNEIEHSLDRTIFASRDILHTDECRDILMFPNLSGRFLRTNTRIITPANALQTYVLPQEFDISYHEVLVPHENLTPENQVIYSLRTTILLI